MAKFIIVTHLIVALLAHIIVPSSIDARYHNEDTGIRHQRHERHHPLWNNLDRRRISDNRKYVTERRDDNDIINEKSRNRFSVGSRNEVSSGIAVTPSPALRRGKYIEDHQRRGGGGGGFLNRAEIRKPLGTRRDNRRRYNPRPLKRHNKGFLNRWKGQRNFKGNRYEGRYIEDYDIDDDMFYHTDRGRNYEFRKGKRRHGKGSRFDDWRRNDDDDDDDDVEDYGEEEKEEDEEVFDDDDDNDDDKFYDDYDGEGNNLKKRKRNLFRKRKQQKKNNNDDDGDDDDEFNEVQKTANDGDYDDDDDDDDDLWNSDDYYDDRFNPSDEPSSESNLKAIDDIIKKLTADDYENDDGDYGYRNYDYEDDRGRRNNLRKSSTVSRRGSRNSEKESRGFRTSHRSPSYHSKRTVNPWGGGGVHGTSISHTILSTTEIPVDIDKFFKETKERELNSSIINQDNITEVTIKTNENSADVKKKSLEQEYEEYENDGSDDADPEAEDDKEQRVLEKVQDYNEDENMEEETDRPEITGSTTPTTTTTTMTTSIPPTSRSKGVEHHRPNGRLFDTRSGHPGYRNFQTTSTSTSTTTTTTTTTTEYPQMSNHSAHKWQTLGSRKAVSEQRNSTVKNDNARIEAHNHFRWVSKEANCRSPRKRVISVSEVYPSLGKTYYPHCTILHRCSDDTGCCNAERTCVPKRSETVELSFFVYLPGKTDTKKLKFENHTECECRLKVNPLNDPGLLPKKQCNCPLDFHSRITQYGECQCHCTESQDRCMNLQRGKAYFTAADRWCIQMDKCSMPYCEFGEYMRKQGRCPLKREKIRDSYNVPNPRYRY